MVTVVFRPHRAEAVELAEQLFQAPAVLLLHVALEDAKGLSVALGADPPEAHGQPAEDGVVESERARVVAEEILDGLPVLLVEALLLAGGQRAQQVVAAEVCRGELHALGVEALEDALGFVVGSVELHQEHVEPAQAPPQLLGARLVARQGAAEEIEVVENARGPGLIRGLVEDERGKRGVVCGAQGEPGLGGAFARRHEEDRAQRRCARNAIDPSARFDMLGEGHDQKRHRDEALLAVDDVARPAFSGHADERPRKVLQGPLAGPAHVPPQLAALIDTPGIGALEHGDAQLARTLRQEVEQLLLLHVHPIHPFRQQLGRTIPRAAASCLTFLDNVSGNALCSAQDEEGRRAAETTPRCRSRSQFLQITPCT